MIAARSWDPYSMNNENSIIEVEEEEKVVEDEMIETRTQGEQVSTPLSTNSRALRPPTAGTAPGRLKSSEVLKKKPSKSAFAEMMQDDRGEMSSLEYATKLVNDLGGFVATKTNIHNDIKILVVKIQKAMLETNKEWKVQIESSRKKVVEPAVELEGMATPLARPKRARPSPESAQKETSTVKKQRKAVEPRSQSANEWQVVAKKTKPKPAKKPIPRQAKKVRPRSDALVIGAKDPKSYAEILKKVKRDPALKELGTQVARIRRTRNGEMLFELKGDSSVKSAAFKGLIEKSLEGEATVRALTQEIVVECRDIDEVTTEKELREELIEQFSLGEIGEAASIRLRKAYGGMQIATIKLPAAEANILLAKGSIKVGWVICPLRVPQTVLLRCYRCLCFGHVAKQCTSTDDRKGKCWRCGEDGHVSKTCKNPPKCMLCQKSEGNTHATGSLRCNAYLKAKARQGWR